MEYCLFYLNEMFDLLHTFTTKKSMKMKNQPPSANKELNSVWADGGNTEFPLVDRMELVRFLMKSITNRLLTSYIGSYLQLFSLFKLDRTISYPR